MVKTVTIWKGAISFGLVNINIELYTATKEHSLGFRLLHAKCNTPISYHRWCKRCNKEVEWQDIVKGLELENGKFFIITKETLEKLRPSKTDYISIVEFIDQDLLEPIYLDHHYYIAPSKETDKAFFLLKAALESMNKIAIGQFVLRDKQYVCAIQSFRNILLLTTLNYEYEIKHVKKIEDLKVPKIEASQLKLAEQLINKLTTKKFDMSKFKDTFAEELKKRIKQTVKGVKIQEIKKPKIAKKEEPTLVQALQASLKTKTAENSKAAKAK